MESLTGSWTRRVALRALSCSMAGLTGRWLTPLARVLADETADMTRSRPARSLILLWLAGGPSQLETFDPHPGSDIAAGSGAIDTAVKGIQIGPDLPQLAAEMESLALVRSLVSNEGDHQRADYLAHTGHALEPSTDYPSLGAICCHELPVEGVEIPRHISILTPPWPVRGGFLGPAFDAFQTLDPAQRVPDVNAAVAEARFARRLTSLDVVEKGFGDRAARRRAQRAQQETLRAARRMMSSEQLAALDVTSEPAAVLKEYGDTPFGRSCLAARRLVGAGVRCVQVTLGGWDTHTNNHGAHQELNRVLDPAFAALVRDLRRQEMLADTLVVCLGEFGRTPRLNALEGRDHWSHGFSAALAGGGLRRGMAIGATDPQGGKAVERPISLADLHATLLSALGIDPRRELISPAERPIKLSDGTPVAELLPAPS